MMKNLWKAKMAVLIALTLATATAMAMDEAVDEDVVDIFATDNQFVAVVKGRRHFSEDRRAGETILWQGARGKVGAFLTDGRVLAISVNSGKWNIRSLKISEKRATPEMLIGTRLVIMLTGERILAFGTRTDGFFQTPLSIDEPVVAKSAEGRVAAVITDHRAFGFSSFRRGAAEFRFRLQESVISVKTNYDTITLRTSERLITLEAKDAVWRTFDLK